MATARQKYAETLSKLVKELHKLSLALERAGLGEYRPADLQALKRRDHRRELVEKYVDTLQQARMYSNLLGKAINRSEM